MKIVFKKQNKYAVRAFAPATCANFICAYDIMGFALESLGDEVEAGFNPNGEIQLEIKMQEGHEMHNISPTDNLCYSIASLFLKHIQTQQGVHIRLHKKMPLSSGLGSSASSIVATLVALNSLFDYPLDNKGLLLLAMEGEQLATGQAHADNVAPAIYGGITLIRHVDPPEVITLPVPFGLSALVIHPKIQIPTAAARQILPSHIPLIDAVKQWSNIAGLVSALFSMDKQLLSRCLSDIIIEPHRAALIPCFNELRKQALENGALGFGISGSGPSVVALFDSGDLAMETEKKLSRIWNKAGISTKSYFSPISAIGAGLR